MKINKTNKSKKLWREYYQAKDELIEFINLHSMELENDTKESFKKTYEEYIRKIVYTEKAEDIENKLQELKAKYIKAIKSEQPSKEITRMPKNFPQVIRGAKNIVINVNNAIQSIGIDRATKKNLNTFFPLVSYYEGTSIEKEIEKLGKKYSLYISRFEEEIGGELVKVCYAEIKGNDLLEVANANKLQLHIQTGNQYILNIRKEGEQRAKRYKYGFTILDNKPSIIRANKEETREHRLVNTCEQFRFGFAINFQIFIKEKRENQMQLF